MLKIGLNKKEHKKHTIKPRGFNRRGMLTFLLMLAAFLLVLVTFVPQALMLFVGMLPSIFTYFIERNPVRIVFRCILPLNTLSVAWIYLDAITRAKIGIPTIKSLIESPLYWFMILGSFATGLAIAMTIPRIYSSFSEFHYTGKRNDLARRRSKLIKIWGQKILDIILNHNERDNKVYNFMLNNSYLTDISSTDKSDQFTGEASRTTVYTTNFDGEGDSTFEYATAENDKEEVDKEVREENDESSQSDNNDESSQGDDEVKTEKEDIDSDTEEGKSEEDKSEEDKSEEDKSEEDKPENNN